MFTGSELVLRQLYMEKTYALDVRPNAMAVNNCPKGLSFLLAYSSYIQNISKVQGPLGDKGEPGVKGVRGDGEFYSTKQYLKACFISITIF